ncbi:hypothetical protein OTU49_006156 [Cherax quadricarinatus]
MFAISLVSLFGYHVFLVVKNRSTLESFRAPIFRLNHTWMQDKDGFSLGALNNFIEVFGDDRKLWFLPVASSLGDGVSYPVRGQQPPSTTTATTSPVQSYGSTQTSLGDGVTYPQRCVDEDTDDLLGARQRWADDEEENELMCTGYTNSHTHALEEVIVQANHTNPV